MDSNIFKTDIKEHEEEGADQSDLIPSPGDIMRARAKRHVGFIIGGFAVAAFLAVAIFAPFIAPHDPYQQVLSNRLIPPLWDENGTWEHPFGTDALGRDYLSRVVYGARISLFIGFFVAAVSALVGTVIGILGGYFGGRVDSFVIYLINVKIALPGLLIALSLVSVFGGSLLVLVLVLAFLFWDRYAVVVRSLTKQICSEHYITAARVAGMSHLRIILQELLPNLMNQIIVIASLEMAVAIIVEAILSFLGLGVQPPTPSWGVLVAEGREQIFFNPYLVNIPGVAIFILVIAINMLGDGIRDITAPENRN